METTASVRPFGTLESGEEVREITLKNEALSCQILTFGATLRTLSVPDRHGEKDGCGAGLRYAGGICGG